MSLAESTENTKKGKNLSSIFFIILRDETYFKAFAFFRALRVHRGKPARIQVDNGSAFTSRSMDLWAYLNKVKLDLYFSFVIRTIFMQQEKN